MLVLCLLLWLFVLWEQTDTQLPVSLSMLFLLFSFLLERFTGVQRLWTSVNWEQPILEPRAVDSSGLAPPDAATPPRSATPVSLPLSLNTPFVCWFLRLRPPLALPPPQPVFCLGCFCNTTIFPLINILWMNTGICNLSHQQQFREHEQISVTPPGLFTF